MSHRVNEATRQRGTRICRQMLEGPGYANTEHPRVVVGVVVGGRAWAWAWAWAWAYPFHSIVVEKEARHRHGSVLLQVR